MQLNLGYDVGEKQYEARPDGGDWVVELNEVAKIIDRKHIARCYNKERALQIAKALNDAEGL